MKTIQTQAVITSISSRADGSLRFSTETPEYTSGEKVAFLDLQGKNVIMTIAPTDTVPDEVLKVEKDLESKPRHVRLRGSLWHLWDKHFKEANPDFDSFYNAKMDRWINDIQEKI